MEKKKFVIRRRKNDMELPQQRREKDFSEFAVLKGGEIQFVANFKSVYLQKSYYKSNITAYELWLH